MIEEKRNRQQLRYGHEALKSDRPAVLGPEQARNRQCDEGQRQVAGRCAQRLEKRRPADRGKNHEHPQHHENGNRRRGPWQRSGGQRRVKIDAKKPEPGLRPRADESQEFPAVRRERSALTSHASDAIMICRKERQRCRRTRLPRRPEKACERSSEIRTHIHPARQSTTWPCAFARGTPRLERLPVSLRANGDLLNNFRLIWVKNAPRGNISLSLTPQSVAISARPAATRGAYRDRHEREDAGTRVGAAASGASIRTQRSRREASLRCIHATVVRLVRSGPSTGRMGSTGRSVLDTACAGMTACDGAAPATAENS